MTKILINNTASPVFISDVGVTVPASGQYTITPSEYGLFAVSSDTVALIGAGTLFVSDGNETLDIAAGSALITGSFRQKETDFASALKSNDQLKVLVEGNLNQGDGRVKVSSNDSAAGFLVEKITSSVPYATFTEIDDGLQETLDFSFDQSGVLSSAITNDANFIDATQAPVQDVNGQIGNVIITKADIGLNNVPNIDATDADNVVVDPIPSVVPLGGSTQEALENLQTNIDNINAGTPTHNTLTGLQGGTANEYYHLTISDFNTLRGGSGDASALHNHDTQYYTKTLLDGGQLDNRYHTQSELNSFAASPGSDLIGDNNTYANFIPTTVTVKGALLGIDTALSSLADDKRVKISADDTSPGFLQEKLVVDIGANSTNALEISVLNDGANEDLRIRLDESKISIVTSQISDAGAANGAATLDASGKLPSSQLPTSATEYLGAWNASTNSPTLTDGVGTNGDMYRVSIGGAQDLGSGSITFAAGDAIIYNGFIWEKIPGEDIIQSVFGRIGVVTALAGDYTASQITNVPTGNISSTTVQSALNELDAEKLAISDFSSNFDSNFATKTTTDLAEGTNLYFTNERAQDAVGGIFVDSSTIDFTYDDVANSITADYIGQLNDNSDVTITNPVSGQAIIYSGTQWVNGNATGSGDEKIINQPAHGFTIAGTIPLPAYVDPVDDLVKLAQANNSATTSAFFITEIIDTDNFKIKNTGTITAVAHGLSVGSYYYLSDTVAGTVTTSPSIAINDVCFYVVDPDTLVLVDFRPTTVSGGGGPDRFLIKTTNTDTSTNLNNNTPVEVPITGNTYLNESNYYTVVGNGIQVPAQGTYRISANVHIEGSVTRGNLIVQLAVNGVLTGAVCTHGYIRNSSGQTETSYTLVDVLILNPNDVVTITTQRESAAGTLVMKLVNTSHLIIESR